MSYKLCTDCVFNRHTYCGHLNNASLRYTTLGLMRQGGRLLARLFNVCGEQARWFVKA